MITIYGIPNCDKCRAAIKWFEARGVDFYFHDIRAEGLTPSLLEQWQKAIGDEGLINKRSLTWRNLSASARKNLGSTGNHKLMLDHPTLIKRPVVSDGATLIVGYDEPGWANNFCKERSS